METVYDISTLLFAQKHVKYLYDLMNLTGNYTAADEAKVVLTKFETEIERFFKIHQPTKEN